MKYRKIYRNSTYRERQKWESHLHYNILVAIIDIELLEEYRSKEYFSCFSKDIAIDFMYILSQLCRRLSKLLQFNILEVKDNSTSEPVIMKPKIFF